MVGTRHDSTEESWSCKVQAVTTDSSETGQISVFNAFSSHAPNLRWNIERGPVGVQDRG